MSSEGLGLPLIGVLAARPGRDLHVRVTQPAQPSGTAVFLVHGAGGRAAQWDAVVPALVQAGHRVVRFDAIGHGDSPQPRHWAAYAGTQWVADLHSLLQRHGAQRNVLVGHSYGSHVVLAVLAALQGHSTQAHAAVLVAPPGPRALARTPWPAWLPVALLQWLRPRLSAGFRAAAWGPDAPPALVDAETAISDRNSLYVFKALWRQRLQLDLAALPALKQPVTVLVGEADRLTPPAGAQALAALLPTSRVQTLPGCGHQIPLEQPQAVIDAVMAAARAPG
jgi:pimeloyl-ACP methyl ester carboxylesterase